MTASVTQINWGFFRLDGGAMFGIIPRPLWAPLNPPDGNNGIRLALRSLVVRSEERIVLVDCGIWERFPPRLRDEIYRIELADPEAALAAAGLRPEEVTDIITSHLHFDHVGGLVAGNGELRPRFPHATLHVQQEQLAWARSPSTRDRGSYVPELVDFIAGSPGLRIHAGPWQLGPDLSVSVAPGHTPAMQVVRVRLPDCQLIHPGDLIPTSAHVPLPYIMAYDIQPLETVAAKERLYQEADGAIFFFEHDPDQPFWKVSRNGKGHWERSPSGMS